MVLTLTEFLRKEKVVGAYLEFYGAGAAALTLGDRATISNMAPEYGATAAMFAIDQQTIDYLRLTGREDEQIALVETYAKTAGLWADSLTQARYERVLRFDLSTVVRTLAGPSNPHRRLPVADLAERGIAGKVENQPGLMPDGAVIIAAITSCTNTSNPRNVIAAGLLARNANRAGLTRKPWVKSSLAPGSKAVALYLDEAGLTTELEQLGFGVVAFACTTCNGMSGALDPKIQQEIIDRDLYSTAVLSGNRNFDGRIHPYAKQAFLASPPWWWPTPSPAPSVSTSSATCWARTPAAARSGSRTSGPPTPRSTPWSRPPSSPSSSARSTRPCSASRTSAAPPSIRCTLAPTEHLHPPPAVLGRRAGRRAHAARHAPAGRAGRQHHHRPPVAVQRHPDGQRRRRIPAQDGPAGRGLQFLRHPSRRSPDRAAPPSPTPSCSMKW